MRHKIVPLVISIGLIVFSLYNLLNLNNEYKAEESYYEELASNFISEEVEDVQIEAEVNREKSEEKVDIGISIDFEKLKSQYKDVVGWIYCEGTQINYPILQSDNNDYYLRRTVDGKESYAGSIFMDCLNSSDFSDANTVLYGHNMKNNSMFGLVPDYINGDMYEKHPIWYILTQDVNYRVDFIGGTSVKVGSEVYRNDSISVNKFIKNNNRVETNFDSEITERDRLVTLSTCVYGKDDYRYVLVGKLTEIN